jgi:hypothetical protein
MYICSFKIENTKMYLGIYYKIDQITSVSEYGIITSKTSKVVTIKKSKLFFLI